MIFKKILKTCYRSFYNLLVKQIAQHESLHNTSFQSYRVRVECQLFFASQRPDS